MAIKSRYVEQLGNILLERYSQAFNTDFEANRDSIEELTTVESEGVRSRIADYVTREKDGQGA